MADDVDALAEDVATRDGRTLRYLEVGAADDVLGIAAEELGA